MTTRNTLFTPAQTAARAGLEKHVLICNFEENRTVNAFSEAEWFSSFLVRTTFKEFLFPIEQANEFEFKSEMSLRKVCLRQILKNR